MPSIMQEDKAEVRSMQGGDEGGEMDMDRQVLLRLSHLIEATVLVAERAKSHAKHCQTLAGCIQNLLPLLHDVQNSGVPIAGGTITSFEELERAIVKANRFVERAGKETSRIYMALRSEKYIHKFKFLSLEVESLVSSLPLGALQLSDATQQQVESCMLDLLAAAYDREVDEDTLKDTEFVLKELREGKKLSHEKLANLAAKFNLLSNQEILKEALLLEKERENCRLDRDKHEEDLIKQLNALVTQMGEDLAKQKQAQIEFGGIPVPADFRCPLSLELMSDPVIVASGQTYERNYIQQWLDQGNMTCPKTRQTLNHTNLIPNYTVKALIATWCEANCVPLLEPGKLNSSGLPTASLPWVGISHPIQNEHLKEAGGPRGDGDSLLRTGRPNPLRFLDEYEVAAGRAAPMLDGIEGSPMFTRGGLLNGKVNVKYQPRAKHSDSFSQLRSGRNTSSSSSADEALFATAFDDEVMQSSNNLSSCSSPGGDSQNYLMSSNQALHGPASISRFLLPGSRRDRGPDSSKSTMSLNSTSTVVNDVSEDETQGEISQLVKDLQFNSIDVQRSAAISLRLLSKHSMDNRILIATGGAIKPLVALLSSADLQTQENAVTALLNLSINDINKNEIAAAGAIDPLVFVLKVGSPEAKENAAATLFSLSVMDENKIAIGQSGAILPLVDLLSYGTPRGKKDAATALFNLSILHANKTRIVGFGAVKPLVKLMADPAAGMVDKAVAVLANLATIPEGRASIGLEGGIPALVEVVEMGSQRGKENAAATLLHLCTNSHRFRAMVLQEGAIPPLVALSQSGTARAKEKASALLRHFREQRQAVLGRGLGPERHTDHRQFGRPCG